METDGNLSRKVRQLSIRCLQLRLLSKKSKPGPSMKLHAIQNGNGDKNGELFGNELNSTCK